VVTLALQPHRSVQAGGERLAVVRGARVLGAEQFE
jgi:hypothetical protein